ncbi:hypothetical protein EDC04DRAFT_2611924 [Pisolithus marmoratus]|nr:hypothetical protein EDC04DRAFT_2611924 [Pisolithus marmoratus]
MSQLLPATQVAPAVAETMGDSDDPMPDYKWKHHNKPKLNLQVREDPQWYSSPKKDDVRRTFETHMHTLHAHSLWATLPPDAMSGDETDHQPGQKCYAIMKLNWRSQAFNSNGHAKHGTLPHTHIPSHRVEMSSQPVPRLLSNFYDAAWLLTLDDDAKVKLKILPEVDLMHTPAVLVIAEKYKHIKGRKLL